MESNKISQLSNNKKAYISEQYIKKEVPKDYKIYTPEIIIQYNNSFKTLRKLTNDKTKAKFIMYNKVLKWYKNKESANFSMEKIYIKTKLGSYNSGGCGIGASLFAGLTASGIISYMDNYIKKLGPIFLAIYAILVLCFGIKILSNEDKKVEMYNMFLEVLNNLENDKNEK